MTVIVAPQLFTYRDAKGFTWTMRVHLAVDTTSGTTRADAYSVGSAINNALSGTGPGTLPLTNGALQRLMGPYGQDSIAFAYGTAAQYLNAEDKLLVAFYDSGGAIHRYGIGCPVVAAFLADQETGKASQLVDFVSAMTTTIGTSYVCTKGGLKITAASGSVLVRRRQRRKFTLASKSSNLDEPGE
jgi:hypothetical protein